MKKQLSTSIAAAVLASAGFAVPASAAESDLSVTAGYLSDYYFRGAFLGESSAYGSLDYSVAGFYAGVWAVDDGDNGNDGLEVDYYLGYGMEHGDFSWSVGFTDYTYTYTHDYEAEINLGLAYAGFGLDVAVGKAFDPEDGSGADYAGDGSLAPDDFEQDYTFVSLGWSSDVIGVMLGYTMLDEVEGDDLGKIADTDEEILYGEVSGSTEISGVGVGMTVGKEILHDVGGEEVDASDYYIYFDISKSFSLL